MSLLNYLENTLPHKGTESVFIYKQQLVIPRTNIIVSLKQLLFRLYFKHMATITWTNAIQVNFA